jgi:hypothetical protein
LFSGLYPLYEAIIHGVNEYLLKPNIDICQFDLRNAFNNADRRVALLNINEHLPAQYPFACAMYMHQTKLWIQHEDRQWEYILSCQGARQGDSIGGVIFNFAMLPLIAQISSAIKSVAERSSQMVGKVFAYYDDLSSAAPIEQQIAMIKIIQSHGPRYGLPMDFSMLGNVLYYLVQDQEHSLPKTAKRDTEQSSMIHQSTSLPRIPRKCHQEKSCVRSLVPSCWVL